MNYTLNHIGTMLEELTKALGLKVKLSPYEKGLKAVAKKNTLAYSFEIPGKDKNIKIQEGTVVDVIDTGTTKNGEPIFYFMMDNLRCQVFQSTQDFVLLKTP